MNAPVAPPPERRSRALRWLALPAVALLAAGGHALWSPWQGEVGPQAGSATAAPAGAPPRPPARARSNPPDNTATPAAMAVAASALPLDRLASRSGEIASSPVVDLFALHAPLRMPSTPSTPNSAAAPPPPPPPQAPRFPYSYLGGMLDDGSRTGFFGLGDQVLALRRGDVVDGKFRVDALDAHALTLTYLPLDERQVVAFGAPR